MHTRKLTMLLNIIIGNLKSVKNQNVRRFVSTVETNVQILSDIFGITHSEAKLYLTKKTILLKKNPELFLESIRSCQKLGFKDRDILENPGLLTVHPLEVQQHYKVLEEGGFTIIEASTLAKARSHMRKAVSYLKSRGFIPRGVNVGECFLKYLDPFPHNFTRRHFLDSAIWCDIHRRILHQYLKWRLKTTDEELLKLFRIHRHIQNKSFRVIQENIEIAESLGFDSNRLLKCGYLLQNYPDYPKTVLKDFPTLVGIDTKLAMRHYPKLVMVAPKNFVKIYGILKEYEVPDEVIRKELAVFMLSPETLRLRLEEINRVPELKVLTKDPRILRLVVHHTKARSRLTFLQQLQLRCASLTVLGDVMDQHFQKYIQEGKDRNTLTDQKIFLKNLFGESDKNIIKHIKSHPYYLNVPFVDMEKTFQFLRSHQFTTSNIFKVMQIILYPTEKIQKAMEDLQHDKDFHGVSLSQVQKLNLMVYLMEKEHHFTGNGIWRKHAVEVSEKTLE